jgi:perosamine synthetase
MITPNSHMNPVYGKEEIQGVTDYLNSGGWIMEHTKTRQMEKMISEYTGAKYVHMVPSATAGLVISAMLANIKVNENFCASAYTQAATVNGAILMGGSPIFIDIDLITHTIDFDKIPEDCRVVFITSINGRYPDDIEQRIQILQKRGCFVVEDTAQALGSWTITNKHCGTMGDVGIFSFGAPKIITTGQGGCIVTNNKNLSDKIYAIKNFGRSVGVEGEIYNTLGINFKFTDIQASFGIEQMHKLPDVIKKKKNIFNLYQTYLKEIVDVSFVQTNINITTPTYPEILVDPKIKNSLIAYLTKNQIGVRSVYKSLSQQPYHSAWNVATPNTDYVYNRGIQLPSQVNLTEEDICKISNYIREFFNDT